MRHITMNIENHVLEDMRRSASIEYWKDDFGLMIRAFIYDNDEMDRYNYPILEKEFDTMEEAINFLEIECERLIVPELLNMAFKGRKAQERLDEIKENGFKL